MSSPVPPFLPPSSSSSSTSPSPSISSTSSFASSSHFHHWILTVEQLQQKRQHVYQRVHKKIVKAMEGCTQEEKQSLQLPTLEQQQQLLSYYAHTLLTLTDTLQSKNFPVPPVMLATALHYYYRFYLSRSILEYHPIVTLYTCLYLSGKTEENYLAVERMTDFLSLSRDWCPRIIKHEPIVLDAIHFHLRVYHPYRAVRGMLNAAMDLDPAVRSYVKTLTTRTHELLEHLLFTDAIFHYVPAQLAAAAVIQASTDLKFDELTPRLTLMLQSVAKQQNSSFPAFSQRLTTIREAITAATSLTPPDVATITSIDRECKKILVWITKRQKALEEKKKQERAQLKAQQRKERQAAAEAQTAALLGTASLPKQSTTDDDTDFIIRKRPRTNPSSPTQS